MKNSIVILGVATLAFAFNTQAIGFGARSSSGDYAYLQRVTYNTHAALNRVLAKRSRPQQRKSGYRAQNAVEAAKTISLAHSLRALGTVLCMPMLVECVFSGHAASSRAPPLA